MSARVVVPISTNLWAKKRRCSLWVYVSSFVVNIRTFTFVNPLYESKKKKKGNMCFQTLFPVSFWSWAETEQQTAMGKQQLLPHKKRPFYRARVVLRSLYWSLAHSFERKREIVGFPLSRTQRRTLRKGTCAQCRWIRFESRYRRKKKTNMKFTKEKKKNETRKKKM